MTKSEYNDKRFEKMETQLETWKTKPGFTISWQSSIGFGELNFYLTESGWICDSECMGKDFVKQVVQNWLDSVKLK